MSQVQALESLKQGVAFAKAGRKEAARPLVLRAVELDPACEPAWMWLASLTESPREALAALERVLTLNPANGRARAAAHTARFQAGVAAARAQEKTQARTLLSAVVAAEPGNEVAWMWLANVVHSPSEAVRCLEKALAVNPSNERARAGLERLRTPRLPGPREGEEGKKGRRGEEKNDGGDATAPSTSVSVPAGGTSSVPPFPPSPLPLFASAPQPTPRPRKTVLTVDDSPTIRKLVTMTLERRGYAVWSAADGSQAIDVLRDQGVPDLILLDINMPGMDGYQLCRLLRQDKETSRLPIIMLSGKDGIFNRVRGKLAGSTSYITKPFEPDGLLRVLQRYCPMDEEVI